MTTVDPWNVLAPQHLETIERSGFENFKRTINFQYGQWRVAKFHGRFMLYALAALLRRGRIPKLATLDWSDAPNWPRHELRAYAAYCGLLWQIAQTDDALGCLKLEEPTTGHPMPVYFNGRPISQDLALSSLDLNLLAKHVELSSVKQVAEIGAGYGRLAYTFKSLFPNAEYTIVDIEPTISVSRNYLSSVLGGGVTFMSPEQFHQTDKTFDLVINVGSFDEMLPEVSTGYLRTIGRICRGHIYLSGYKKASQGGRLGLEELPYPEWRIIYNRHHELFPNWQQKIFQI